MQAFSPSRSISVVIPAFNRGAKIKATIDSALAQDVPPEDVEILVVDDGSTDDTFAFLQANYGHNPRVRLFSIPNRGVAGARNFGLEQARGEFIAFLDHDDLWLPQKLRLQLRAFEGRPETGVVGCDWVHVDEDGAALPDDDLRVVRLKFGTPSGRVFDILVRANFIVSMSVPLVRTEVVRDIGGFDPRTVPCDDWDLWLRLARVCKFDWVPMPLVRYVHSAVQQSSDQERMWRAAHRALSKHRSAVLKQPKTLWIILSYGYFLRTLHPFYHQARAAISRGDWPEVRRQLARCFWRRPLMVLVPQWLYIVKRLVTRDARPF